MRFAENLVETMYTLCAWLRETSKSVKHPSTSNSGVLTHPRWGRAVVIRMLLGGAGPLPNSCPPGRCVPLLLPFGLLKPKDKGTWVTKSVRAYPRRRVGWSLVLEEHVRKSSHDKCPVNE